MQAPREETGCIPQYRDTGHHLTVTGAESVRRPDQQWDTITPHKQRCVFVYHACLKYHDGQLLLISANTTLTSSAFDENPLSRKVKKMSNLKQSFSS